ncbi:MULTISPECIES: dephospho-CoA kinase [Filomicrobium]|uniref:Dephospho-CoA kinase n=1 Tax=Filomicrobium insigne TaxID=418854 RepID=A0A1H0JBT8_9HYPH|nr:MULTISPECIES: dephospho-CoA kinase [Filomicrobium]MCV0368485.1 dephospho-CoA kinase [Filomicrobium sp.]SDO40939.1 dephospho-CoA kinase [Filomicrobium insigne]
MLIIGLTGSIGMGKSTAAERFRHNGVAVFDADAAVHELYRGPAAPSIERAFPGTTENGVVDRQKLAAALLEAPEKFRQLEDIVHPMVREVERQFLRDQVQAGAELAVLEIPLLIETGADNMVDVVVVVSAEPDTQRKRVLDRSGMSIEKLEQILSRQVPDAEKRKRADFVVDTNGPIESAQSAVDAIVQKLREDKGRTYAHQAYHRHWS